MTPEDDHDSRPHETHSTADRGPQPGHPTPEGEALAGPPVRATIETACAHCATRQDVAVHNPRHNCIKCGAFCRLITHDACGAEFEDWATRTRGLVIFDCPACGGKVIWTDPIIPLTRLERVVLARTAKAQGIDPSELLRRNAGGEARRDGTRTAGTPRPIRWRPIAIAAGVIVIVALSAYDAQSKKSNPTSTPSVDYRVPKTLAAAVSADNGGGLTACFPEGSGVDLFACAVNGQTHLVQVSSDGRSYSYP